MHTVAHAVTVSRSFTLGALLGIVAHTASAYPTPTIADCNSPSCRIVNVSSGNLAAQAIFEVTGSNLFVTLANTSIVDITTPSHVLTSLLFNLNYTDGTAVALSPLSALMNPSMGSAVVFDSRTIDAGLPAKTCDEVVKVTTVSGSETHTCETSDNDVGGEWEYVASGYNGFTKGIGSAGLGLFTNAPNFGTNDLDDPLAVNGGNYGITSAGDDPNTDINGDGYNPVTQNAVQFKLAITPDSTKSLNLAAVGALSAGFQYGTDRTNPFLMPSPGTLALLGIGVVMLIWRKRA